MNIHNHPMRHSKSTPAQENDEPIESGLSARSRRRHTAVGVIFADAAAAGLHQTRWLTINYQSVPIAAQLERHAQPILSLPPTPSIDAEQLSHALQRDAADLVNAYTLRLARDIGYGLSALHNREKRAYLGLTLKQISFVVPATFCLSPSADERPLNSACPSTAIPLGTPGYSSEDQLQAAATSQDTALLAIDSFSWAASVCAFALGEPFVPIWSASKEPKAWVKNIFAMLEVDIDQIISDDEKVFFAHWALDHACSLVTDAYAKQGRHHASTSDDNTIEPAALPLGELLLALGEPWPVLPERLGSLFPALLPCFDLQWSARPRIESLLKVIEIRREWPAPFDMYRRAGELGIP